MKITIRHRATKGRRVHVRTRKHTSNPIHQATCQACWDKLTKEICRQFNVEEVRG